MGGGLFQDETRLLPAKNKGGNERIKVSARKLVKNEIIMDNEEETQEYLKKY